MIDSRVSVADREMAAKTSLRLNRAVLSASIRQIVVLLAMLFAGGAALAQSVIVKDVRIGRLGDRWLDTQKFQRIERASEDGQYGYAVTYRIAGHGDVKLFWPRKAIAFARKSPRYRLVAMKLRTGRLWYPTVVTARSLPAVHRGVLELEAMYARDARSEIVVFEALAGIASLGASAPSLRALPGRPVGGTGGRMSSSSATSSTPPASGSGSGVSGSRSAAVGTASASAARSVKASPRVLARALEDAGQSRPLGAAAHHIVAGNARLAAPAREVLQKFGIGINDAKNGVFLPATKASPNPTGAAVHSTLHTGSYYANVNVRLMRAKTRIEVENSLEEIGQILLQGGF